MESAFIAEWCLGYKSTSIEDFLKESICSCIRIWKAENTDKYNILTSENLSLFLDEKFDIEFNPEKKSICFNRTISTVKWEENLYLIETGFLKRSTSEFIRSRRTWYKYTTGEITEIQFIYDSNEKFSGGISQMCIEYIKKWDMSDKDEIGNSKSDH